MRNKKTARSSGSAHPREPHRGLLIAVELGAAFPHVASAEAASEQRKVLTQRDGESPAAFADRVSASLDGLFGKGISLGALLVACNERADAHAAEARRKLAEIALGCMAKHQTGRASFVTPERSSGRVRQALTSLAQGLHDEWRTAGLDVTVDFRSRATSEAARGFLYTARVA